MLGFQIGSASGGGHKMQGAGLMPDGFPYMSGFWLGSGSGGGYKMMALEYLENSLSFIQALKEV